MVESCEDWGEGERGCWRFADGWTETDMPGSECNWLWRPPGFIWWLTEEGWPLPGWPIGDLDGTPAVADTCNGIFICRANNSVRKKGCIIIGIGGNIHGVPKLPGRKWLGWLIEAWLAAAGAIGRLWEFFYKI